MKIIVIDDEPLIHISIERLIQKYSEDIHVFHAYNGSEMQNLMKNHDFTLAYVDIKLPGMTGLEAIRQAKEFAPHTIYYIMTGFDKFEYAKEAIRLKVEDYLMKPLDYETIKTTIEAAINIQTSYKRERKTLFRNWLESVVSNRECLLDRFDEYYRLAVLITMDKEDFPLDTLLNKVMQYSDNFVSTYTGEHILLLCFSENVDLLRNIGKKLSYEEYSHGISMFSSSIVRSDSEMRTAIKALLDRAGLRVILGTEKHFSLKPLMNYDSVLLDFCRTCESWKRAYIQKSYNEFINISECLCCCLERNDLPSKYHNHVIRFLGLVTGDELSDISDFRYVRKKFQRYAAEILKTADNERLVDSIIQYINEHFRDNISTTMLSEQFGLSSNYISNLLKQELGIRYNDYITQLRMEHSKQLLLSTNMSVKNITAACGYYSQSHFTKLFVEREGCTPLEFRKIHKPNS